MDRIAPAAEAIRGRGLRVVLPESADARIPRAAARLCDEQLAVPILLGDPGEVAAAARRDGLDPARWEIADPRNDPRRADVARRLAATRGAMTEAMALRLMTKPLYFGGALVAAGHADAMVAGVANPTRRVIEASLMTIGLASGIATPSSYFLMLCPHAIGGARTILFADCAVTADPSPRELADIAIASAESARRVLATEPRVALLSFSTHASAAHAAVDKVRAAVDEIHRRAPGLAVDGELQADAALSPLVAAKKVKGASPAAGIANVLVFPDLDAGNIAYKLVQYLGGATAIGPFLQGFARPVSDLSRGAGVDDIVATVVMTLAGAVQTGPNVLS